MYVDLSKAYDSIDRARLWEVLLTELGLSRDMVCSLQRMYSDLAVELADHPFGKGLIRILLGLKQGCPCSPVLFSLYFDRVERALQ